ncbi:MAG: DNA integrity scanning protein DisA nucleotide-binding domain protein [Desulfobacteraceae bacterium]
MPEKEHIPDKSIERINGAMITHAREIATEINATAVLAYVDAIQSERNLESLIKESRCILAARNQDVIDNLIKMKEEAHRIIPVPYMELTRLSQIKVAVMVALSSNLIQYGDLLVCLSGSSIYGILDNLMVMEVGREFEIFSSKSLEIKDQMDPPHVFARLLTIAMELSEEGKEGKPIGTIFVLGDHHKVMELSSQMIINPFSGVPENDRNILNPDLKETIREFATIDGAFIVRKDGVIVAAGRHLKSSAEDSELPQGLGARHRAALGITALTDALAVTISESNGDVRVFSRGKIFMEIEKRRKTESY